MRLLYLYPEEWTGRRAREVHTLSTCVALARAGVEVTLLVAGGEAALCRHLLEVSGAEACAGLKLVALSRRFGLIRSIAIFRHHFHQWRRRQPIFDAAYIIHLKAAALLVHEHVMPYAYEAHEIFAQALLPASRQQRLHELERQVVTGAALRIATSSALAEALRTWFAMPNDFVIVPNAGLAPLPESLAQPDGPLVYAGSIADWKGLELVLPAAREAGVPVRVIGGEAREWNAVGSKIDTAGVEWHPRQPLGELPKLLRGARAGLIPTLPDTASGRYSCPMKLFDYARCGLPVISTALPSLDSLDAGSWCHEVEQPSIEAWTKALRSFGLDEHQTTSALAWSAEHTWAKRAELLLKAFDRLKPR